MSNKNKNNKEMKDSTTHKASELAEELIQVASWGIAHVSAANYQSRTDEATRKLIAKSDEVFVKACKLDEINKDLLEALIAMVKEFNVIADSRNEWQQEKAFELAERAIKKATS